MAVRKIRPNDDLPPEVDGEFVDGDDTSNDERPFTRVATLDDLEGVDLEKVGLRLFDDEQELPVDLTEQEWHAYVEQNAVNWTEIEREEAEEKERRSTWGAEHKARKAEHSRVAKLVHDKTEDRTVKIAGYGLIEQNACAVVRVDTGGTVEVRALDANERERCLQPDMFKDKGGE